MHGRSQQVGRFTIERTGEAVHNVDAGGTRPPPCCCTNSTLGGLPDKGVSDAVDRTGEPQQTTDLDENGNS